MSPDHYGSIRAKRFVAQEYARLRDKLDRKTPEQEDVKRQAAAHVQAMLEEIKNADPEIARYPERKIEVIRYLDGESEFYTFRLRYGNKLAPTLEEKLYIGQREAPPFSPGNDVPREIVSKDYFRTGLVTVRSGTVTVSHGPIEVYFPEAQEWVKCTDEIFPTELVAKDPSVLYGAMDRLVWDVTQVTEVYQRGIHYWREPRK